MRLYAPCDFEETKFLMYVRAMTQIALNANNKVLKWMRSFNGSQCSSYINGVIWLKCGAQQTGLAALFKTRWTFICQYSKSILKLPKRIDIFSKIFSKTSCLKARFIDISSPVSHFGSIFDQQLFIDHKQPRIWLIEITVKKKNSC